LFSSVSFLTFAPPLFGGGDGGILLYYDCVLQLLSATFSPLKVEEVVFGASLSSLPQPTSFLFEEREKERLRRERLERREGGRGGGERRIEQPVAPLERREGESCHRLLSMVESTLLTQSNLKDT